MSLKLFTFLTAILIVVGGVAFLAIWQPEAQPAQTEIAIPNDRLSIQ